MLRIITIAAGLACGAMLVGCAADVPPRGTIDQGPATAAEPTATPPQTFKVWLRGDTRAEAVLQPILKAGHAQLVEARESNPDLSVRVYNPLASGVQADVPCASILRGNTRIEGSPQTLTSESVDEVTGESQQTLTPVELLCGLLSIGVGLASTWSCEKYPDKWCPWPAAAGTSTLSLVCMFL